ncbi:hypothetical protein BUALT_Bualt07G0070200 [Buddleja alternifolia]|uniref:Uncharacterized protein n=1 Tax=Buddleja alternifolia TaxID=168488 RepID=A0AAV6XFI5_9LAMI|nr:hypothetical protein BUALT_Bualt07G0070200 [Buddleja alternifolia]
MPGNELGDGVHNFFAQDNPLQGQHHSQVVEGNWPVLNSNFWVGSERQVDLLNSNNKNYNSQNSDLDRGGGSYPLHVTHGLNFTQSNLRPEFTKSQSLNEQPNLNGFMYGNQFQQGSGPDHQAKASVRSVTSVPPVSFDLFGGQQQMSHQQASIQQSMQRQQSGINDMQQLQQQLMMRKMQEHQRQQQLQQLDLRQHHLVNQAPSFAKQTSGGQSALVNGTPNSDTLQYPWTAEPGTNWLNRGSPMVQGSPNGLVFQPNLGATPRSMDLVPQQVDQSLYGVPISSSKGLPVNQYSQLMTERSSLPQMSISSNSLHGNQHSLLPDQIGIQDESSISSQKFQHENMFGLASRQSLNPEMINMGIAQPASSMSRNAHQQDFLGRQEPVVPSETSHEKPTRQVDSPQNEAALDPTEEQILFGSDDNIWAAFGKDPHMSGDAGNSFDNGGLLDGLSSIQSGSWSALMQSAVAETSSSDIAPQEEWSGLTFHNNDRPSANQPPSLHNDSGKQAKPLANDNMRIPSAPRSGSVPPSNDIYTNNVMALNQLGHKFQNEPGQRWSSEMPQRFVQSLEEANKWSNSGPLTKSVAEGSQTYRTSSQNLLEAERNAKSISPPCAPGQTGTRLKPNGWNSLAAIPPGGDRVQNNHEAEKFPQNSQNSQARVMQGGEVHGSSLWKSKSVPNSAFELGDVNYTVGNPQANTRILSLNDAASVANSSNAGISDETSSFVHNNYLLNQWRNARPQVRSQGDESLGRRLHQANERNQVLNSMNSLDNDEVARREMENCDVKENSNDSHRSNLSQHTGGFREGGFSDASDSQSLPSGKQKSTNQLSRKVTAPRKFQYHPMGNVYEDVESTNGLKQPTRVQAMSQQNAHFGQSKLFGQVTRDLTVMEKGQSSELQRDTKGTDEEPSRGNLSGHAPNVSVPFSQPIDTYTSNKASSSSQNMLELLHKVDQSKDHDVMKQFSSSQCNASSQLPEAEKLDGVGRLQRSQSSVYQGFGLQLGPPSQRLQIPDHPLSSQNGQDTINSLPFVEETQVEFKNNRSAISGHGGNENSLYKMSENFTSGSSSGIPYSRSHLQNQQITRVSGQMSVNQNTDPLNGNPSHSTQRGSAETLLPDASGSIQQYNLASFGGTSQQSGPDNVQERVPTAAIPTRDPERTYQHFTMPGISRQGDSAQETQHVWTNVPTHQHKHGIQFQQVSSHNPDSSRPTIVESSSMPPKQGFLSSQGIIDDEEQRLKISGQPVESINTDPVPKMKESLGKGSSMKNQLDDSPANSASTQNDIEAFGRSLKPNSSSNQNYCLLNQMQALKDADIESSNRVSGRMKGLDVHEASLKAGQQNEHNALFGGDSLGSSTAVSSDSRMLNFSRPAGILQRNTSQHGNLDPKDTLGPGRDVLQSNSFSDYTTSVRVDQPQISPQMAPSWFNQYGTFKNGQMYGASKLTPSGPGEPPSPLGMPSIGLDTHNSQEKSTATPVDVCQIGTRHQNSTPSSVANGHFSSPQLSQPNVTGQHLVNLRPKKRKSATSELHPWRKELSEDSQNIWTISKAESEWNRAVNRRTEKVEAFAELIEDGPSVLKSKRRLIMTSQLMQQLLRPAPATILSSDASSNYEIVSYAVSRMALGDACSTVSHSSDLDVPRDSTNLLLAKSKSSGRNGVRFYAKAIEELIGRARKLENDFLRLDKSASISDLRVECQDLEKFSVINRFARFHGRGPTDNAETSSNDATTQKPIPQRYVTAVPVPRILPDGVQCLSL